jgi:hypothetical protein
VIIKKVSAGPNSLDVRVWAPFEAKFKLRSQSSGKAWKCNASKDESASQADMFEFDVECPAATMATSDLSLVVRVQLNEFRYDFEKKLA